MPKSSAAFRPLVEGVVALHQDKLVHRDIKRENVYLDEQDRLVLGDFGLVYFIDDKRSRLSAQFENVGSRDWEPPWAQGVRLEKVTPAFDVFSLGKMPTSILLDLMNGCGANYAEKGTTRLLSMAPRRKGLTSGD
ncbi:MAG: protein kinase [Acidobacteriota bacterium]